MLTFTNFNCPLLLIHLFKKMKHWNLNIANWLLSNWDRLLKRKGPETLPQSSKFFKRLHRIIVIVYSYLSVGQVWWLHHELWIKRYIQKCTLSHITSCTNTHPDVTDLVNHDGMVKNTKNWISWEWNIIFLWNKKILNLCFRENTFWEVIVVL